VQALCEVADVAARRTIGQRRPVRGEGVRLDLKVYVGMDVRRI
jgi:hypothetical protein